MDLKGSDVEVLKQLEERTKLNKDGLFRKKKELQRLVTDYEEDLRRLEQVVEDFTETPSVCVYHYHVPMDNQVKAQNDKMLKQQDHLQHAKSQVEEELVSRQSQLDELAERMLKQVTKHRQKALESGVEPSTMQNGTIEEKAVKAEVYKTVIQVNIQDCLQWGRCLSLVLLPERLTLPFHLSFSLECALYFESTGDGVSRGFRDLELPLAGGGSSLAIQTTCEGKQHRSDGPRICEDSQ